MGKTQSKIENPTANVLSDVNEVVESVNPIYLIIIIILLDAQLATTLWQFHKRRTFSMLNCIDFYTPYTQIGPKNSRKKKII